MEENKLSSLQNYYFEKVPALFSDIISSPEEIQSKFAGGSMWFESNQFQHSDWVTFACFNKDSTIVLTVSDDKIARLWNRATGGCIFFLQHDERIRSACFNKDNTVIMTVADKKVLLWDAVEGKLVCSLPHDEWVASARFSKDCSRILTSSGDKAVRLWNAQKGDLVLSFQHDDYINSECFSKDNTLILTTSGNKVYLWNAIIGNLISSFKHNERVGSACFNKDNTLILTASDDKALIWSLATGKIIRRFRHYDGAFCRGNFTMNDSVELAYFNKHNNRIITISSDHIVRLWNATTSCLIQVLQYGQAVFSTCFNKNNNLVLTNTACLWNAITGKFIQFLHHDYYVMSACFNKDNNLIITGSKDDKARIWQQYTNWSLDQLLLCKLLFTRLLVEKPSKAITTIVDFIAKIKIDENQDTTDELIAVWNTFPINVQASIWNNINRIIQKHGK